jgi:hypothetical protein
VAGHVDLGEQLARAPLASLAGHAAQAEGDIVEHAEVGKQGEILEHQPDPARLRRHRVAGLGDHLAVDHDAPALQRLEPGDQAQDRGLAATRGADQAMDLAGQDGQADVLDHAPPAIGVAQSAHREAPNWPGFGQGRLRERVRHRE